MISRSIPLFVMVLIMLLGFALGAAQLNADILWVDEMASVAAMGVKDPPHSFIRIIESLASRDPYSAPLYFIVGAGWALLVGWSQVALRYLSLLLGILSIAILYRFAADMLNRRTALLAAFFFATNALIIIYFHELRFYTMWVVLSVAQAWQYWRLSNGVRAGVVSWLAFAATTGALLYTHPFSVFVLLGLGVHHFVLVAKDRRWFSIVFAWGTGIVTFLPYVPILIVGMSEQAISGDVRAKADATSDLIPMLANAFANGVDMLWLAIFAAGGWTLWRGRSRGVVPLLLFVAMILASIFVFHEVFPFLSSRRLRYFVVALTFALVLFAHFLMSMPRWHIIVPAVALVWLAGGHHIYQQAEHWQFAGHHSLLIPHPPLHRFTDALQGKARSQDAILSFTQAGFLNSGLRFGYSTTEYYSQAELGVHGAFIWTGLAGSELRDEFERRVGNHPYLLFTYEPSNLPANFSDVKEILEQKYAACGVLVDTETVFAQRYALQTLACDRAYHEIQYDNGIKIIDAFAVYDDEAQSVRVVTGWEVEDQAQLEEYNVSVQLITPEWEKARQAPDRHLYDNILTWYAVELSIEDLPPGIYNAMVILYDRYSGKKVSGVEMTTGRIGDIFAVLSFTIDA